MSVARSGWSALVCGLLLGGCGGGGGGADVTNPTCTEWPESWQLPDDLSHSVITAAVAVDPCGLMLGGHFNAPAPLVPSGDADGFVMRLRLDEAGQVHEEWRYLLRTELTDSVAVLERVDTGVRFLGWTNGVLPDQSGYGKSDVVIGHLSDDGDLQSLSQLGDERPNRPLRMVARGAGSFLLIGNDDIYVPTNYVESWEEPWVASVRREVDQYRMDWLLRTGTSGSDLYQAAMPVPSPDSMLLAKITYAGPMAGLAVEQRDPYGTLLSSTELTQSPYDVIATLAPLSPDETWVFGSSYQNLGGGLEGSADLFLALLTLQGGGVQWIRQFGGPDTDWAAALVQQGDRLFAVSEVFVDEPADWQVRLTRLSLTGDVIDQETLHHAPSGAVQTAVVTGEQLAVAGAVKRASGEIRGWVGFVPLSRAD